MQAFFFQIRKIDAQFDPKKASRNDAQIIQKRSQSDPKSDPTFDFFAKMFPKLSICGAKKRPKCIKKSTKNKFGRGGGKMSKKGAREWRFWKAS